MSDLYNHIADLGKEHGYKNMTALCSAADVPRTTMSELKAGRSKDLSKPNAQKFADLLGVSLNDIYETKKAPTVVGERREAGEGGSFSCSTEEQRLLELWRKADGIDRQTIWSILSRYDEEAPSAHISLG